MCHHTHHRLKHNIITSSIPPLSPSLLKTLAMTSHHCQSTNHLFSKLEWKSPFKNKTDLLNIIKLMSYIFALSGETNFPLFIIFLFNLYPRSLFHVLHPSSFTPPCLERVTLPSLPPSLPPFDSFDPSTQPSFTLPQPLPRPLALPLPVP